MSEHQRETAFLRQCLRYDDSADHRELDESISQIQRDERCVRRAVWLMVGSIGLALAGLGYAAVLLENFAQDRAQLIAKIIAALGLASMICLVVFLGLRVVYRKRLDERREQCRQLVTKLLESRLGKPVATPWRETRVAVDNRDTLRIADIGDGSPEKTQPTARS